MAIRILLADDHPIVLDGLEALFRLESDFAVVGRCLSGDEVLPAVRRQNPDLLLLDIRMPGMDGMEVLRALHRERLATRVVLLAAAFEDDQVVEALRLGVRGMVLKELAPPLLIECVRRVHAGGQWIEQQASGRALESLIRRDTAEKEAGRELTPREIELVRLAASGLRNREMSRRLEISEGTVKMHLHNVYRKLKLENRVALANYARQKGLL
ncbi:MAG: response regulator transcription factor [Gemmatimonadales bacterium]